MEEEAAAARTEGSPLSPTVKPSSPSSLRAKSLPAPNGAHSPSPPTTIFSKFSFFRDSSPDDQPDSSHTVAFPPADPRKSDHFQDRNPLLASVLEAQSKSRKRKGSLRKTALLTGGRLRLDRHGSNVESERKPSQPQVLNGTRPRQLSQPSPKTSPTKQRFSLELPSANSSSENLISTGEEPQVLSIDTSSIISSQSPPSLRPCASPTGPYASPTSDDDSLIISGLLSGSSVGTDTLLHPPHQLHASPSPSPPSSESSLAAASSVQRRRASKQQTYPPATLSSKPSLSSPLTVPIIVDHPTDEWDYSETEWWGWIILLVTWIVVVVGMGSCLGVWSWAWDVGHKNYAPPELEDDPTLPIVGYYPALMVLTAVMSWVWVVVAWVGMKYFKHAKIQSED